CPRERGHGGPAVHRAPTASRDERRARGCRHAARRARPVLGELLAYCEGRGGALAALHPGQGEAGGRGGGGHPPRGGRPPPRLPRGGRGRALLPGARPRGAPPPPPRPCPPS